MKLSELKSVLRANPGKLLRFVLPDGEIIPEQFHVTEVGHVSKHFIDCGGTVRRTSVVQLQLWLGNDREHRLPVGKFAAILDLAADIIPSDDFDVEVEYEDCSISQYPVSAVVVASDAVEIRLATKHTDCLAKEACGVETTSAPSSGCCGGGGCG